MGDLVQKTAADGFADFTCAGLTLAEAPARQIWHIAPYPGRADALSALLPQGFPAPNRALGKEGARLIWAGRDQALWIGKDPAPAAVAQHAALTDQTDAWCVLRLQGDRPEDVLARLCPLDLSPAIFKRGHTARSLIGHMTAQITRRTNGLELMFMRSMAQTALHELTQTMRQVAARRDL